MVLGDVLDLLAAHQDGASVPEVGEVELLAVDHRRGEGRAGVAVGRDQRFDLSPGALQRGERGGRRVGGELPLERRSQRRQDLWGQRLRAAEAVRDGEQGAAARLLAHEHGVLLGGAHVA